MELNNHSHTCLTVSSLQAKLESVCKLQGLTYPEGLSSVEVAKRLDDEDPLRHFREKFYIPKIKHIRNILPEVVQECGEEDSVYLNGNSLGLQPRLTRQLIQEDLDDWATLGVQGHTKATRPWVDCDEVGLEMLSRLVGASKQEVGIMNGLSVNLHLLMVSFYRPTPKRNKILIEKQAFPSDHYITESQLRFHGYDPKDSLILLEPRPNEKLLRLSDILSVIESHGSSLALVLLPGVQYYTGQVLDMEAIAKATHHQGAVIGVDLAHAVGNISLALHDWDIDFAAWCNYKYLNSGAGSIASIFVHSRHLGNPDLPRFTGWFGHQLSTRFNMDNVMDLCPDAQAWRISNPPPLLTSPLIASLRVFSETSMDQLRSKSMLLTFYLETLIKLCINNSKDGVAVEVITPSDVEQRGCQLSLSFKEPVETLLTNLVKYGVLCDVRLPSVVRVAPTPLYNSFLDVYKFVHILKTGTNLTHSA